MIKKEAIEINESNKSIFLKYTDKIKEEFDRSELKKKILKKLIFLTL